MKLEVDGYSKNFIYCGIDKTYLRKDGTIGEAFCGVNENFWSFKSRQEAQQFLDSWMPQEKQLSIEQIKQAAEFSEKTALDFSIEHWKQNVLDVENANLGSSYCASCLKAADRDNLRGQIRCENCIVNGYEYSGTFISCCKEYDNFCDSRTEENATAMLNKLVLIRNKKYGNLYLKVEEKKMSNKIVFDDGKEVELSKETTDRLRKELIKPDKLKHGDIVQDGYGKTRIVLNYKGKLVGFQETCDFEVGDLDRWINNFGYNTIGNVFEDYEL